MMAKQQKKTFFFFRFSDVATETERPVIHEPFSFFIRGIRSAVLCFLFLTAEQAGDFVDGRGGKSRATIIQDSLRYR